MKNIKRKGFTLVELLIVIVVIGILSAMMMLSSTEAVTSARASNIVSNLRNFKTAAMAMYVDYYDKMDQGTKPDDAHGILVKYMNKDSSSGSGADSTANYHLKFDATKKGYYVYAKNVSDTRVQAKLAGRASSVGLLDSGYATYTTSATDATAVYMFVTSCDAGATSATNWTTDESSSSTTTNP